MSDRLPSALLVGALLRRVNDAGGIGVVLAKGDPQAGAILVVAIDRDRRERMLERGFGPGGETILVDSTPTGDPADYWRRRRARDPDLWVVEVDVAAAERFTAETILGR